MELEDHVRALCAHSLDTISDESIDEVVQNIELCISEAKNGDAFFLLQDIWGIFVTFRGLDEAGRLNTDIAYGALRDYITFILDECPDMRDDLARMFAPFPEIHTALL